MRQLSPPPTKIDEFNYNWKNWLTLLYEIFIGNKFIDHETVTTSTTANKKTIICVDATAGAITITLPKVVASDKLTYYIKKIDVSANAVTVDGDGSETIDGATTQSLPNQWDYLVVACTGSVWYLIG